ncbi:hypothetical protein ACJX0J_030960, partial [Zea mays]
AHRGDKRKPPISDTRAVVALGSQNCSPEHFKIVKPPRAVVDQCSVSNIAHWTSVLRPIRLTPWQGVVVTLLA